MALERIKSWKDIKIGNYRRDINYTFDYIMDLSERNNLRSTFYFKTSCTNPCYDDNYSIKHPYIRQLLQDIYDRGHVIGLHPSYETYLSLEQIQEEFYRLLLVCEEEGIKQERWGGRQHYLRWKVPITWRNWAQAGLDYDSSLAYAEHAGFRCGICYEYPVYDLEQRKILSLFERPLVVMEGSVMGKQYMNLSGENALNYILMLKDRCCLFDGNFTLLWHNSYLIEPEQREIYKTIVGK
ncbi:MAG: hypothetical protein GYA86_04330 [Firmicutes bacterium]|nr:hypothetical protein [Bacillota bacterium]